ncbi:helix-turn-helix domain-containing protein [Haloferula sp. A504]|uniref:helix-turn-helix domain-containing protein n=1 Tax=Haloferula sp. A504 TaxID=3373601 RepID=UPI0031C8D4C4|nr:helix-turn-helix domain-containing protein [Verrucomicrobiaceae bacterium E54]
MNKYEGIDEFITTVINKEISKLLGRFGITPDDVPDLQQDLQVQVWKKLAGEIDPDAPHYRAAVRRTVDCRIKDILDHINAEKRRTDREALRLEAPVEDDEASCFGDLQDLEEARERYGGGQPAWHHRRHRRIDVIEALARLPGELRHLADTFEEFGGNLSAAARALGMSRKKARCDLEKLRDWLDGLLEGPDES